MRLEFKPGLSVLSHSCNPTCFLETSHRPREPMFSCFPLSVVQDWAHHHGWIVGAGQPGLLLNVQCFPSPKASSQRLFAQNIEHTKLTLRRTSHIHVSHLFTYLNSLFLLGNIWHVQNNIYVNCNHNVWAHHSTWQLDHYKGCSSHSFLLPSPQKQPLSWILCLSFLCLFL